MPSSQSPPAATSGSNSSRSNSLGALASAIVVILFTVMYLSAPTGSPPVSGSSVATESGPAQTPSPEKEGVVPPPPPVETAQRNRQEEAAYPSKDQVKDFTRRAAQEAKANDYSDLDGIQTEEQTQRMLSQCTRKKTLYVNSTIPFDNFIDMTFDALNEAVVGTRPIFYVMGSFSELIEKRGALANGFWVEFGVFKGATLLAAHNHLQNYTDPRTGKAVKKDKRFFKGVVGGFDSFQGLPVNWRQGFGAGEFGQYKDLFEYVRDKIPAEVELYKGWFQNTIGQFKSKHPRMPASFIHHDGDLFVSTAITFSMLADRIVPGTIMCFDELQGYFGFEQHEILALYLWMVQYDVTLCALAVHSKIDGAIRVPLPPKRKGNRDSHFFVQSSCFQVLSLRTVKKE